MKKLVNSIINLPKVKAVLVLSDNGDIIEESAKPGSSIKSKLDSIKKLVDMGNVFSEQLNRKLSMIMLDTPEGYIILHKLDSTKLTVIEGERNLNVGRLRLEIRKTFK